MARGEVLQHQRLAFFAARVVEVDAWLERAAFGEPVRLRARAREVLAADAAADVDLGRLRAVAAGDRFPGAASVVVVGGRAERVGLRGAFVRVAGPAAGLAGYVGVADARRPRRSAPRPVGARGRGHRSKAPKQRRERDPDRRERKRRTAAFSQCFVHALLPLLRATRLPRALSRPPYPPGPTHFNTSQRAARRPARHGRTLALDVSDRRSPTPRSRARRPLRRCRRRARAPRPTAPRAGRTSALRA